MLTYRSSETFRPSPVWSLSDYREALQSLKRVLPKAQRWLRFTSQIVCLMQISRSIVLKCSVLKDNKAPLRDSSPDNGARPASTMKCGSAANDAATTARAQSRKNGEHHQNFNHRPSLTSAIPAGWSRWRRARPSHVQRGHCTDNRRVALLESRGGRSSSLGLLTLAGISGASCWRDVPQ
jgi:hypothetical protein